ncbi:uncharacterized protein MONOS_12188 [Monocercomonoides exilis]|uniref:uncharacterized protein n=1 Tax=Monocercomonoides exilis TaxID=2049356 RepID=UPI00355A3EE5|nr:hypothetical protein MONOS_12188 [Monocercomonoides exilis]|eukprot:MONOS_12188.1-p1 / transcript=MONOS_12188.1 / gene=MONOS_12188 / organism=Monocercomonoides_exilis_PA203 / gene_product=unspecified product / transcript_product=unspecified product / location=Mono_scaffold00657:25738-28900(-) / protein_length=846 / sequence_SO=supercontig / SO=protein_coding / is_pseudo=false
MNLKIEGTSQPISTVYVKQSGKDENSGLAIGQEKPSLKDAYDRLGNNIACNMKIVYDDDPLTAEAISFNKEHGITIEGWKSDESGNTEGAIDCNVQPGRNLFECKGMVEFKCLSFYFPTTLRRQGQGFESLYLIYGHMASLSISNCRFIRPEAGYDMVDYRLVDTSGGSLTMESLECTDEGNTLTLRDELFRINEAEAVILSNLTLKKIVALDFHVINILNSENNKIDVILNGSTFTELKGTQSILFVGISNSSSTFSVGDGGVTTFSSCSCDYYNGCGGIYLKLFNIKSASQIKWPENGRNLIFDKCTSGRGSWESGVYIHGDDHTMFEEIAAAMKKSFAANYTRKDNLMSVIGYSEDDEMRYVFVLCFIDQTGKFFVKNSGIGEGLTSDEPSSSLKITCEYMNLIPFTDRFYIEVVKDDDPLTAEEIIISNEKGVTMEGVNSDGNGNVEVAIDCDVRKTTSLFTCEKEVEFKYLAFNFPMSGTEWNSLIFGTEMSTSLTINNCRFVRIGTQSPDEMTSNGAEDDEDDFSVGSLVSVVGGKVIMNTVSCVDDSSTVSFSSSVLSFKDTNEVSLNGVDISNVKIFASPAVFILNSEDKAAKIVVEGLNIKDANSEKGDTAGLEIILYSEESTVAIGRTRKCSFKSCTAPKGKAGAMAIVMPKATSNLQLPSANNLEIDSSNTANSTARSICIIAPDFDEFCKQEGSFEFANDYDNSTAGWIVGAKDTESEPEDAYEKYMKAKQDRIDERIREQEREQDRKQKEKKRRMIVAIVVPIVVVVVVAIVVVVVVFVVVKKRKAKSNKDGSKEQEMSSQEESTMKQFNMSRIEASSNEETFYRLIEPSPA